LGQFSNRTSDQKEEEELALKIQLNAKDGVTTPYTELRPLSTVLDVFYSPSQTLSGSINLANIIAEKLQELFAEEQSSIAFILSSNPGGQQLLSSSHAPHSSAPASSREPRVRSNGAISPEMTAKLARRKTRSLKYAPSYHISISLFSPSAVPTSWDIDGAVAEYLTPLLKSFSISNFTVDTQVQLYAQFSPSMRQPEFDTENKRWTIREEDLSGFINAAEWPLSPSIGSGPTLNFLLYVPDQNMTPLVVKDSGANSWLIPQWGGVTILNPSDRTPDYLTKEMIQPAILTFSHQLLSLLGAPDTPSSFPLQLRTLTRVHAASLFFSASSTMGSLARLSESLASIPIPEEVLLRVERTLEHLRATCSDLRDGKSLSALQHARIAEAEAEKAFFEKSMVGQVYFPDEHKVAVYLPLLGPIGVPLITSLVKEIRRRRGK
jgi:GPI-anchor transamidase subunit S